MPSNVDATPYPKTLLLRKLDSVHKLFIQEQQVDFDFIKNRVTADHHLPINAFELNIILTKLEDDLLIRKTGLVSKNQLYEITVDGLLFYGYRHNSKKKFWSENDSKNYQKVLVIITVLVGLVNIVFFVFQMRDFANKNKAVPIKSNCAKRSTK